MDHPYVRVGSSKLTPSHEAFFFIDFPSRYPLFWWHHLGCSASAPIPRLTILSLLLMNLPSAAFQSESGLDHILSARAAALGQTLDSTECSSTCSDHMATAPPKTRSRGEALVTIGALVLTCGLSSETFRLRRTLKGFIS